MPDAQRRDKARLPVVLITKRTNFGTEGVLLGTWSGKLLGDMGLQEFMTRPLYFGGVSERGLSMLHAYPDMPGSVRLTEEGLAASNEFGTACDWVTQGPGSSLRFKFFHGCIFWKAEEVQELSPKTGVWIPMNVSLDLLLREPDSAFEESLWVQIAEKDGGELAALASEYGLLPE